MEAMESNGCGSGQSKAIVGKRKLFSGIASKHNTSASCGDHNSIIQKTDKIPPIIRILHIVPPQVIKTDPANFRALVQKLTGKHSAGSSRASSIKYREKKMNPRKTPEYMNDCNDIKKKSYAFQAQSPPDGAHYFCPKENGQTEFLSYQNKIVTPLAQLQFMSEYLEQDVLKSCDIFSGVYDGFADTFTALAHSRSIVPKFPTIDSPTANQPDAHCLSGLMFTVT